MRIDGVLQLQNFALHIHRDLAREVAVCDGGSDLRDVADLRSQVAGHRVHAIRKILPRSSDASDFRVSAQLSLGTHFARHARYFGCERAELIHHGVDGVLQLQNFAAHVHRDLARKISLGHGGSDFRDVAHLIGQVTGHRVDALGKILPGTGHAFHFRLAAQFAFGTHFARHARYFGCERAELIHHGVDGVLQFQNFAASVHRDLGS